MTLPFKFLLNILALDVAVLFCSSRFIPSVVLSGEGQ